MTMLKGVAEKGLIYALVLLDIHLLFPEVMYCL
jgi:hypothetical protein